MPTNTSTLSEKEMRLLALSWQCFKNNPDIDYEKLAPLAGYTIGSARTTMGNIRRKLKSAVGDTTTAPATSAGGKRKTASVANGVSKRGSKSAGRSAKRFKKESSDADVEDDDEDDMIMPNGLKKENDENEDGEDKESNFEF